MPTREELYTALRNADKAGDVEGARKLASYIQSLPADATAAAAAPAKPKDEGIGATLKKATEGAALGVSDLGNTVLNVVTAPIAAVSPKVAQWNRTRNADFDALTEQNKDSTAFKLGRVGGNVAATLPVGGTLAAGARALGVSAPLVSALATSGMRAGGVTGAAGMGLRMAGGAATGGVSAALVNPDDALVGAGVGAVLPPALAGVGRVARAIGAKMAGPVVAPEMRQAVQNARDAGYVIPPSQAKPTLLNRALEGFAGKLSTAQNASAKNQPITNELAKKAIGAADLSEAGIAQVRARANQAYDALGQVGKFQADSDFVQALDDAGASTAAMRQNFPELVHGEVDALIDGLKTRAEFGAQPTIEAIKQFRADAATNRAALDPAKKALGRAQGKIANALEDLIDRNLQATGNEALLDGYRTARQTLAKTYDVEKALNATSGNVDGNKLAQLLKKGRPLSGELRTIADFAAQFPKAAQPIERMGSLPGVSPLDFGALGAVSAATSNPLLMAGVLARPAARAAVLAGPIQNRLATAPTTNRLTQFLAMPETEQLIYRAAPVTLDR